MKPYTYCRLCGARNDQAHYRGYPCTQPHRLNWPLILLTIFGFIFWLGITALIWERLL